MSAFGQKQTVAYGRVAENRKQIGHEYKTRRHVLHKKFCQLKRPVGDDSGRS